jgi:L-malate glycosyltransferase
VKIGIVCYASVGGSGIVATELARSLAARGHQVHVISSDIPFRLREQSGQVHFHRVETPAYPLFREPQYALSLSNSIVQVARAHDLDIVHAHYAVPHAAAAYLARQILAAGTTGVGGGGAAGAHVAKVPKVITTLHGTDITLVGSDPSYSETVAFCIDQSDGVTAVSESLKADTYRFLPVKSPIEVIPNFLDCSEYRPRPNPELRARLCPPDRYDGLILHISNFRPVKRLDAVLEVFRRVRDRYRAKLVLAGDGPERARLAQQAAEADLTEHVEILGEQDDVRELLSSADVFLLPSAQESFGLAAAEAMACGTPVVASRVGGLPEVITDGETGFLHDPYDLDGMAASALALLTDANLRDRLSRAARATIVERYCEQRIVPMYEEFYARLLNGRAGTPSFRTVSGGL